MEQSKNSPRSRLLTIGTVAGPLTRRTDRGGQSPLGAVVADALQAGAKPFNVTVAALVDPRDLHGDLTVHGRLGIPDGTVTLDDGLSVLPLSVASTVVSLTGAQLLAALEAQFAVKKGGDDLMQVSQSISYRWSSKPANGTHVDPASVTVNSAALNPAAAYLVVLSDGLRSAPGGNSVLRGIAPVTHGVTGVGGAHPGPLFDNFAAYLSTRPGVPVPAAVRVSRTD